MWLNIYVGYAFPMERIHIGCSLMVDMRGVFSIEAQNDADLDSHYWWWMWEKKTKLFVMRRRCGYTSFDKSNIG